MNIRNGEEVYRDTQAYSAIILVNAGEVYFGNEVDDRRLVRVGIAAVDLQAVDAILVGTLDNSK